MSLYKRLHEAEEPVTLSNHRNTMIDELRQKIHHHLIDELGPVLYDKRLSEQEMMDQVYRKLTISLCTACYARWIENPAGDGE